ncbi:putative regulatory protein (CxxC_CxxC_SSSS) [delta proteobacterium NaphS2]|nr:putative regulatory protein (CxxC_CxxC_SSSS) [delta proteobacterium NaphS2]
MPIYEYECKKCGHHVEALQKISDPPILECDQCHSSMKKLISQSTFHLKGTGWYVTDYASKNSNNQMSAKETSSSDSDTTSKKVEAKSDGGKTAPKESTDPQKSAN